LYFRKSFKKTHHSLPLMNSFNKTEAAVFSCRLCFLRAFPFISFIITLKGTIIAEQHGYILVYFLLVNLLKKNLGVQHISIWSSHSVVVILSCAMGWFYCDIFTDEQRTACLGHTCCSGRWAGSALMAQKRNVLRYS